MRTSISIVTLSSAKRERQVQRPSPMSNVRWTRLAIPSNALGILVIARQSDLLTPKVVAVDAAQVVPELALGECVPEVEHGLAGPEACGRARDFDRGARLAVEPLFLIDVATGRDLGHIAGQVAVDGGIPDGEIAVVVDNSVGCEGGAGREGEGGEEGCEAHDCGCENDSFR
jgi:hypothetical protein